MLSDLKVAGIKSAGPLWVFGYGSILWKTDFPYEEQRVVKLPNHARRFWQSSVDHRGTPGYPGVVVTLIPRAGEDCWGISYRISERDRTDVIKHLDHREKGGYEQYEADTFTADNHKLRVITYIADQHNRGYMGETSNKNIADRIRRAHGPSGSNKEYILKLNMALSNLGIKDEHVSRLAYLVSDQAPLCGDE